MLNLNSFFQVLDNCISFAMEYVDYFNEEPTDIPQDTNDPVWILGIQYNATRDLEKIRKDILSRLWITYRKNFPSIGESSLTTDRGWGCMLRCGQMVLAQALLFLHLGREWHWEENTQDSTYIKILQKFEDKKQACFSIQQIALTGTSEGKSVGQWFGPNTIAQVLKKLIEYDEWRSLTIHVALDNVIVINEIKNECSLSDINEWKPLLLIVPLRLGITTVNQIYVPNLQKSFEFPQSLGVIGGKPNLALYFIGYVGKDVLFLDPHTNQRFGTIENKQTQEQIEVDKSYHCRRASRMDIMSMDPSIALCFLCKTESDFLDLCDRIKTNIQFLEIIHTRTETWNNSLLPLEKCSSLDNIAQALHSEDEFELL